MEGVKKMGSRLWGVLKKLLRIKAARGYYLKDVFHKKQAKRALLCYVTIPFRNKIQYKHTNQIECYTLANVLDELGFAVDVIDYDHTKVAIAYESYDLLIGFGNVLEKAFKHISLAKTKTIYYGTGNHYFFVNAASLERIREMYERSGHVMWRSARYSEYTWSFQTTLVDGMIVLGNEFTADTFRKYYRRGMVFPIPASFHKTVVPKLEEKDFEQAKTHFLWFGSNGALHKGLDLLLDIFKDQTTWTLHVCGANPWEKEFFEYYQEALANSPAIVHHGFVDIHSSAFSEILHRCACVIFPSASEGGCASVVTAMGNGGLIPIVSKSCGLDVEELGWIFDRLDIESIRICIEKVVSLPEAQLRERAERTYSSVNEHHALDGYKKRVEAALREILNF